MEAKINVRHGYAINLGCIKSSHPTKNIVRKLYEDTENRTLDNREHVPMKCISIEKPNDIQGLIIHSSRDNNDDNWYFGDRRRDLERLREFPEFTTGDNTCVKIDKQPCVLYNGTFFWEFDFNKKPLAKIRKGKDEKLWESYVFDNFCELAHKLNLELIKICDSSSSVLEEICLSESDREFEEFSNHYCTEKQIFHDTPNKVFYEGRTILPTDRTDFSPLNYENYSQENMKEQYGNRYFGFYFLTKHNLQGLKVAFYIKGRSENDYLLSLRVYNSRFEKIDQAIKDCVRGNDIFKLDARGTDNVMLPLNSKEEGSPYVPVFIVEKYKSNNLKKTTAPITEISTASSSNIGATEIDNGKDSDDRDDDDEDDGGSISSNKSESGSDVDDNVPGAAACASPVTNTAAATTDSDDYEEKGGFEIDLLSIPVNNDDDEPKDPARDRKLAEEAERYILLLFPHAIYTNIGIFSKETFLEFIKRVDFLKKTKCFGNENSDTRWDLTLFFKIKGLLGKEFILQKPLIDFELICCYFAFVLTNRENNICLYREGGNEKNGYEIFKKIKESTGKYLSNDKEKKKAIKKKSKGKTSKNKGRYFEGEEEEEEDRGDAGNEENGEEKEYEDERENDGDEKNVANSASRYNKSLEQHSYNCLKSDSFVINPSLDYDVASLCLTNLILANRFCVLYNIVSDPKFFLKLMEKRNFQFVGESSYSSLSRKERNKKYLERCSDLKNFCDEYVGNRFPIKKICRECLQEFSKHLYEKQGMENQERDEDGQERDKKFENIDFDLYNHPLSYCHKKLYHSNIFISQIENMFPSLKLCHEVDSVTIIRKYFCVPFNLSILLQKSTDNIWPKRLFECNIEKHLDSDKLLTFECNDSIENLLRGFNYNIFYNEVLLLSDVSHYIGFTKMEKEILEENESESNNEEDDEEDENDENENDDQEGEKTERNDPREYFPFSSNKIKWGLNTIGRNICNDEPPPVSKEEIAINCTPLKEQMRKKLQESPKKIEAKLVTKLLDDLKWYRNRKGPQRAFRYENLAQIYNTDSHLHGTFDFEERYFQIMCAILFEEKLLSPLDLNQMVVNVKENFESLFRCFEAIGGFDDIVSVGEEEPFPSLLIIADSMDVALERNEYAKSEDYAKILWEKYEQNMTEKGATAPTIWHSELTKEFEIAWGDVSGREQKSLLERKILIGEMDKLYLKMQKQFYPIIFNEINWNSQIFFLCEKASKTDVFSFLTLSGKIIVKYLRLRGIFKRGKEKPERGFAEYLLFQNMFAKFKIGKFSDKKAIIEFIAEDSFLGKNISKRKKDEAVFSSDASTDADADANAEAEANDTPDEEEIEYEFYCFMNFCLYWNWVFNYVKMEHMTAMVTLKKILERNFNSLLQVWNTIIEFSDVDVLSTEEEETNDLEALVNVFKAKVFGFVYFSKERALEFKRCLDVDSFCYPQINDKWIKFVTGYSSMIFGAQIAKRKFIHLLFIKLCTEYCHKYDSQNCYSHLVSIIMEESTPELEVDSNEGTKNNQRRRRKNNAGGDSGSLWNNEDLSADDQVINKIKTLRNKLRIIPKFNAKNFLEDLEYRMKNYDEKMKEKAELCERRRNERNQSEEKKKHQYYKATPKFYKMELTPEIKRKMEIIMWNDFIKKLGNFILLQLEPTKKIPSSPSSSSFSTSTTFVDESSTIFDILNKRKDALDDEDEQEAKNYEDENESRGNKNSDDSDLDCIYKFVLPPSSKKMSVVDKQIEIEFWKARTGVDDTRVFHESLLNNENNEAKLQVLEYVTNEQRDDRKVRDFLLSQKSANTFEAAKEDLSKSSFDEHESYIVREYSVEKCKSASSSCTQYVLTAKSSGGSGGAPMTKIKLGKFFGDGLMTEKYENMYGNKTNIDTGSNKAMSVFGVQDNDKKRSVFYVPSYYQSVLKPIDVMNYFKAITYVDMRYIIDLLNWKFISAMNINLNSNIGFGLLRDTRDVGANKILNDDKRYARPPPLSGSLFDSSEDFTTYDLNDCNRDKISAKSSFEKYHSLQTYNTVCRALKSLSHRIDRKTHTVFLYREERNVNSNEKIKKSGNHTPEMIVIQNSHNVMKSDPTYNPNDVLGNDTKRIRCHIGFDKEIKSLPPFGSLKIKPMYLKIEFHSTQKIPLYRIDVLVQTMNKFAILRKIIGNVPIRNRLKKKIEKAKPKNFYANPDYGLESDKEYLSSDEFAEIKKRDMDRVDFDDDIDYISDYDEQNDDNDDDEEITPQSRLSSRNKILLTYCYHAHKDHFLEGLTYRISKFLLSANEHQLAENYKYEFKVDVKNYAALAKYTFSSELAKLFNQHHCQSFPGPEEKLFVTKNENLSGGPGCGPTLISYRPNVLEADGGYLICGYENELFAKTSKVISNEISVEKLALIHDILLNFDEIVLILQNLLNANSKLQGLSVFVFLFANDRLSRSRMREKDLIDTIFFVIEELASNDDAVAGVEEGLSSSSSSLSSSPISRLFGLIKKNKMYLYVIKHLMIFIGYANVLSTMDNEFMHHLLYTINQASYNMLEKTITILVGVKGNEGKSNFMTMVKKALFGHVFANCPLSSFDTKAGTSSSAMPNLSFLGKSFGAIVDEASTKKDIGHNLLKYCTNHLVENLLTSQERDQKSQRKCLLPPKSSSPQQQQEAVVIASTSSAAASTFAYRNDNVYDYNDEDDEDDSNVSLMKNRNVNYDLCFELNSKLFCSSSSFTWNDRTPVIFNVSPNVFLAYHHFTQSSILRNTDEILRAWHKEIFSPIIKEYECFLDERMRNFPPHVLDTIKFSNNIIYLNKKRLESCIDKETYLAIVTVNDKGRSAATAICEGKTDDGEKELMKRRDLENESNKKEQEEEERRLLRSSPLALKWLNLHKESMKSGKILVFVIGNSPTGQKQRDFFDNKMHFENSYTSDYGYNIIEENGEGPKSELTRISTFPSDKVYNATKLKYEISINKNKRRRFIPSQSDDEDDKGEEEIEKNNPSKKIKIASTRKSSGIKKKSSKRKKSAFTESDYYDCDPHGMKRKIKRMKYSCDRYISEKEILPSIEIKAGSCPAILSSESGGGNNKEPKTLVYKNVSNVFNDGGKYFNKKTGIYDGGKNLFSKDGEPKRHLIKPDLLKTITTPQQEMQFRNIYETPSTIRVNCQLFLLANSFDVDYPVDDAMQKRHLVFSLSTVNETGPTTDKFLDFVSDFGDFLPLFNSVTKEENNLRKQHLERLQEEKKKKDIEQQQQQQKDQQQEPKPEQFQLSSFYVKRNVRLQTMRKNLKRSLKSLFPTHQNENSSGSEGGGNGGAHNDDGDGDGDGDEDEKLNTYGFFFSKIAQFVRENKVFPRFQLKEKNIGKSLNSFFSLYSMLMLRRCDDDLPLFKQAKEMKSIRTSIEQDFNTFDEDVQMIMSTPIFFPFYKNRYGTPRNLSFKRIDKTILSDLRINGYDRTFTEAYMIPFNVDVMDMQQGGNVRTISAAELIEETLQAIGRNNIYDLTLACHHIHLIYDYVSYYDPNTKSVLNELKDSEEDEEISDRVWNFLKTSHKITMPLILYEKMMQTVQSDKTFSIYECYSKYQPPPPLGEEEEEEEGEERNDKDIEVYPLMVLRKKIPLTVGNKKYHQKLMRCIFKTFKIFRLDLCCDECKEVAFNL